MLKHKLFFVIVAVVAAMMPGSFKHYVREIEEVADMNGFFDGYRAGVRDASQHYMDVEAAKQ